MNEANSNATHLVTMDPNNDIKFLAFDFGESSQEDLHAPRNVY